MDKQTALQKIKKLLALADPSRGGTASETEAAMAMASKMMRDHDVAMSDVMVAEEDVKVQTSDAKMAASKGNVYKWEKILACVFEQLLDVKVLMVYRPDGAYARYFGAEGDAAVACEMYAVFHEQIKVGARGFKEFTDKRSYCLGYAREIFQRAKELREKRRKSYGGTQALVYVGKKEAAIAKAFAETSSTKERSPRTRVSGAYAAGLVDGSRANLGYERRLR